MAKKAPLLAPAKPGGKSHPVTILLAFVGGVVGGFLVNRWLRIWI